MDVLDVGYQNRNRQINLGRLERRLPGRIGGCIALTAGRPTVVISGCMTGRAQGVGAGRRGHARPRTNGRTPTTAGGCRR